MMYSVVDIGSNTVRLVTYKTDGPKYVSVYTDFRAMGLISKIENGRLIDSAVAELCDVLTCFKNNSPKGAVFLAFATAFMRVIENSEDVRKRILSDTGIDLEILSEQQEAIYSFNGIMRTATQSEGIAADLGGGSCEFIKFEDKKPQIFKSLPFGCVKLGKMFVENNPFPSLSEMHSIRNYVTEQLAEVEWIKGTKEFILTGGTGKAFAQMGNFINKTSFPLSGYTFSYANFERLYTEFTSFDTKYTDFIKSIMPSRIKTIYPGLEAAKAIVDYIGSPNITISTEGVREGFIAEISGR